MNKSILQLLLRTASLSLLFVSFAHAQGDLLTSLPDWNDERDAYVARSLNISVGNDLHIEGGRYSGSQLATFGGVGYFSNTEIHTDTEGDELWTAYQMWKRLEGIHPNGVWRDRMNNLKNYFINDYASVIAGSGRETDNNNDHLYGWGLCDWYKTEGASEPDGGAQALIAIDGIVERMIQWNGVYRGGIDPGDPILNSSNGSRRWARQLRFAVCAAEVSPTAQNVAWRDRVIDIMLQTPDYDANRQMYFYDRANTDSKGFNYDAGDRIANTFHMGIWMDAMWHAWRVMRAIDDPRADALRQRVIGMATFYRDFGPDTQNRVLQYAGLNINSNQRIAGGSTGSNNVYSISPINGLVFGYKLTGSQGYLDTAWALWLTYQDSSGSTIRHYTDTQISSSNGFRLLSNNKGELQYIYALFENGGNPVLVTDTADPPPAAPANLVVQ